MVAMSIFFIGIIALKARLASALSWLVTASINMRGLICQEMPHRSLHQPHWLSCPPLLTMASHKRSVSAWSSVWIWKEKASLCLNAVPPLRPTQGMPQTVNSTVSMLPSLPSG